MISILIPVHNTLVLALVKELSRQLKELPSPGEIIIIDDHSSAFFRGSNKAVNEFDHVLYEELGANVGRMAVRQLLAQKAQYEWLLFIDSDSRITQAGFLQRYITAFTGGADVYAGGRSYPEKPKDCKKALHWKYGVKRESVKGSRSVLHTNNFCIKKTVFNELQFPGFLTRYGHEDTWMQMELERRGKKIKHINNQVQHVRLEDANTFLSKTNEALHSLLLLSEAMGPEQVSRYVGLFREYRRMQRFGLSFVVDVLYRLCDKRMPRSFNSCNPSLFLFDLYRLHGLAAMSETTRRHGGR